MWVLGQLVEKVGFEQWIQQELQETATRPRLLCLGYIKAYFHRCFLLLLTLWRAIDVSITKTTKEDVLLKSTVKLQPFDGSQGLLFSEFGFQCERRVCGKEGMFNSVFFLPIIRQMTLTIILTHMQFSTRSHRLTRSYWKTQMPSTGGKFFRFKV